MKDPTNYCQCVEKIPGLDYTISDEYFCLRFKSLNMSVMGTILNFRRFLNEKVIKYSYNGNHSEGF